MPIDFLTAAERERLNHFPDPIPDEDLRVFFTLSDRDTQEVRKQRGAPINWALRCNSVRCGIWALPPMTWARPQMLPSPLWPSS
jgi:hypothetical protein